MRQGMGRGAVLMLLVAGMAMMGTGCRGRAARRSGRTDPGASGVGLGPDFTIEDVGMGDERFAMGREVRGQFDVVFFGLDNSNINPAERGKVEQVAEHLRRNPGVQIIVEGHCCERGSAEYNLALGERRALAVRAYLVGLGIDPSRIQTVSYGEERPSVQGTGDSVLRQNRRAEFVIVR